MQVEQEAGAASSQLRCLISMWVWVLDLGCVVTISLDNDVLAGDSSSTRCPVPGVRLWFVGTMGRSLGRGQSSENGRDGTRRGGAQRR